MYNNGLQNSELQLFHKSLGLNLNLFLEDILEMEDLFQIIDKGDKYFIYPLFYCDSIKTDGEGAFINETYLIIVPKDYKQIFLFITDNPIEFVPFFTVREDYWQNQFVLFAYDLITLQPLRNRNIIIRDDGADKNYTTNEYGYLHFEAYTYDFEVIF